MSSNEWDDFEKPVSKSARKESTKPSGQDSPSDGCGWGQIDQCESTTQNECQAEGSVPNKFIELYERYLNDKKSLLERTNNYKTFVKDPQKELRDWFDNEGHEFKFNVDQPASGQFVCSLDLPVDDQDFTLTSEPHVKRKAAIDEVCLDACRMLDDCQLLYTEQSGKISQEELLARKRRILEATREDDIVFDRTTDAKRLCLSTDQLDSSGSNSVTSPMVSLNSKVNTYESLMAKWTTINMNLLQSKARLVKLDLSVAPKVQQATVRGVTDCDTRCESSGADNKSSDNVVGGTEDDDDEIDPLDEFMSNLEAKTKLSMDDKIEKSRLKVQIATYERQQEEVARLLEVAKPSFNPNKIHLGGGSGKKH